MTDREILLLIGVVLATLSWLGLRLHRYSLRVYAYSPFRIGNFAFILVPIGTFVASFAYLGESQGINDAILAGNWAVILLCLLSIGSLGWFLRRIKRQTSTWVSIAATLLMLVAAVVAVVVVLIVLSLLSGNKKRGKRDE